MNATSSTSIFAKRRALLTGLGAACILPALQGCFPLVAGGATAATMMAVDRRTSGAYVEDEGIEWRTRNRLREQLGDNANVSVTSYNRNVLLTGQVANEAAKAQAGRIATGVENVKGVINELVIGPVSTLSSRSNDALITSKVRARFVDHQLAGSQHVKVVTEAGTVFLLGIVTRTEADSTTQTARTTAGVQKVVRVFEYVTDEEALRLDRQPKEKDKAS